MFGLYRMIALLALVLAAPVLAAETPDPDNAVLQEVGILLQGHKGNEALNKLAPLIEANDRKIEEAQAKGQVYCATDMGESLSYLLMAATAKKQALVLLPSVCHGLYFKAYALNDLGRRTEGAAMLERLIALAPMHSQYFSELAFTYSKSGNPDMAEKTYRKALENAELSPDEASKERRRAVAWRGIGYALVEKHDLDGASEAYRQSLKYEPNSDLAKHELDYIAHLRKPAS